MKTITTVILGLFVISAGLWAAEESNEAEKYWPAWRGPNATGVAPLGNPPIEWNENQNIRWKLSIPGKGHSSPVIWGDLVFVTTAIEINKPGEQNQVEAPPQQGQRRGPRVIQPSNIHQFVIFAISRSDGSIRWQKTVREELPHESMHPTGSWASNSPVTDGEHVYAYFGSRGLYCFDMGGTLQWEKDLGDMTSS